MTKIQNERSIRLITLGLGLLLFVATACDRTDAPSPGGPTSEEPGAAGEEEEAAVRGRELEQAGRWSEAAPLYRRLALGAEGAFAGDGAGGDNAVVDRWARQAIMAYFMADAPEAAERFAGEVLVRQPDFHEILLYLGDSQRVTMRFEAARANLEKLLERQPGHLKGSLALGHVLVELGEAERALSLLENYLAAPETATRLREAAQLDRVRALRQLGRRGEAADRIAQILERRPFDPATLSAAIQTFAMANKPSLARSTRVLYQWLSKRGHQLTTEDPTTLHATGPRPEAATRLALQAADRREFVAAVKGLTTAAASNPAEPRILEILGKLLLRLRRFDDCLERLKGVERSRGLTTAGLYHVKALALEGLGRIVDARAVMVRAVASIEVSLGAEESPALNRDEALRFLIAAADFELSTGGDPAVAAAWYDRVAHLDPKNARAALGRARAALERGSLPQARDLLKKASLLSDPGDAEYRRLRAIMEGRDGNLR